MFCENVRSLWVLSVNYSAYFIFIIAAESLMWFWSAVNIKHHYSRVVFASALIKGVCEKSAKTLNWGLFDAEMKLCVLFSRDGFDACINIFQNQAFEPCFCSVLVQVFIYNNHQDSSPSQWIQMEMANVV